MLKSNCIDTECFKYNEEMHCNCESWGWDYVDECHVPDSIVSEEPGEAVSDE